MSQYYDSLNSLYNQYLGRDIGESGLNTWGGMLSQGGSLQDVQNAIMGSQEYANRQEQQRNDLNSLYNEYLGRDIGEDGLSNWGNLLASGGTLDDVRAGITGSQEYANLQASQQQQQPSNYNQLLELMKELGLYKENAEWSNSGIGINDDAYYDLVTNGSGVKDQYMVADNIGLGTLVGDSFANRVTGAERDKLREELAAKYLDQLKQFQQSYSGGSTVADNNPAYNDQGVPSFGNPQEFPNVSIDGGQTWGQDTDISNGVQGQNTAPAPGPSIDWSNVTTGPDYQFTQRSNSTPFIDAYMRAKADVEKPLTVKGMFAKELGAQ